MAKFLLIIQAAPQAAETKAPNAGSVRAGPAAVCKVLSLTEVAPSPPASPPTYQASRGQAGLPRESEAGVRILSRLVGLPGEPGSEAGVKETCLSHILLLKVFLRRQRRHERGI